MSDLIVNRAIRIRPGARSIRPCFPCHWQAKRPRWHRNVLAADSVGVGCPDCGTRYVVTIVQQPLFDGSPSDQIILSWKTVNTKEGTPVIADTHTLAPVAPAPQTTVARLAAELGESESKLTVQNAQWSRFMREGAHVKVEVHRWRGTVGATLEDLGLEPDLPLRSGETQREYAARLKEARASTLRVLQLGNWRLLPQKEAANLDRLDIAIRRSAQFRGFKTVWGTWVHTERYAEWKTAYDALVAEFEAAADDIYARWDELMAQTLADLATEGEKQYARAKRSDAYRTGAISLPDTVGEFVVAFTSRVMGAIPSRDEVRRRFWVEYSVSMIPMASQIAEDQVLAQRIQLDAVTAQMAEDIKRSEQERAARGMRDFVADVQGQIRAEIYDTVVEYLEAFKAGKNPPNTKIVNLVEKVTQDMFWQDEGLEARLAELKVLATVNVKTRDMVAVTGALKALGAEARVALIELDRLGEREEKPALFDDELDVAQVETRGDVSDNLVVYDELAEVTESDWQRLIGRSEVALDI